MAITFDLQVGRIGAIGTHPWGSPLRIPSTGGTRPLEEVFLDASSREIQLRPLFASRQNPSKAGLQATWPIDLHEELEAICANPPGQFPIPRLGLLLAPRYGPRPEVFGVMFDTGFRDDDQANLPIHYWSTPREGAAVFVEAIRARRPNETNFEAQVSYTMVHELSHLFNLQHTAEAGCFLDTSPAGPNAPLASSFRFLDEQRRWLALCATDPRVQPGRMGFGSPDYFDRAESNPPARSVALSLTLKISLSLDEFFRWEPVELEVTMHASDRAGSAAITVPGQLDPGFGNFVIWIEEPSGERRRYRPTKHYCPSGEMITLAPGKFFRRDISIFGESGGLTFRQPGRHRIWCVFGLPDGGVVRSNVIEHEIRSERFSDSRSRSRYAELRSIYRMASRVFFYRSGKIHPKVRKSLEAIAGRNRTTYLGAVAHYALGRWLEHQVHRNSRHRRHWAKEARPHLKRACDSKLLSAHQRAKAQHSLERIRL
jgi:hypothetical protein